MKHIISSGSDGHNLDINKSAETSNSFEFVTTKLPNDQNLLPTLSNGHIGFTVLSDTIYLNGVYNGRRGLTHRARIPNWSRVQLELCAATGGGLGRTGDAGSCRYKLNVRTGLFSIEYEDKSKFKVIQYIYPHRHHNRAIVNQFLIQRLDNYQDEVTVKLRTERDAGGDTGEHDVHIVATPVEVIARHSKFSERKRIVNTSATISGDRYAYVAATSAEASTSTTAAVTGTETGTGTATTSANNDILFNSTKIITINNQRMYKKCGKTIELEDGKYQNITRHVCVLWNHVPEEITLKMNKNFASYTFLMTIDEDFRLAKQEMMDALSLDNDLELLHLHTQAWEHFWKTFDVKVEGNPDLESAIHSSLFYLVSSLPSQDTNLPRRPFYGLSPTGLGRGGANLDDYEGHSFWDTETWMLPPITLIEPSWTEELLHYRFSKLQAARDYASATGYSGARFPWESAYTGAEVTQPCCPQVAEQQQHITADISFALRYYFAATNDFQWLEREGCQLSNAIGEFWSSRVERRTQRNDNDVDADADADERDNLIGDADAGDFYEIRDIMGPDEDHANVANNIYTNIGAAYALYFGDFTNCLCHRRLARDSANKSSPAAAAAVAWSDKARHMKLPYDEANDYHPQYDGYELGTEIKQADAVLIGYPLGYRMNESTRRNDLNIYENATRSSGPAMSWAMYAINRLDVGDVERANELFNKSYQLYIRRPFNVWNEVADVEQSGATNFITGSGGFLQAILNGYAGVRVHLDRMEIVRPRLPPQSTGVTVKGILYLHNRFQIEIRARSVILRCLHGDNNLVLIADGNESQPICHKCKYDITGQRVVIKSADDRKFARCPVPDDVIGVPIARGRKPGLCLKEG